MPRASDRVAEVEAETRQLALLEASIGDAPPAALPPDPAARHRRVAAELAARGQPVWARGHLLRALEIEAGLAPSPP